MMQRKPLAIVASLLVLGLVAALLNQLAETERAGHGAKLPLRHDSSGNKTPELDVYPSGFPAARAPLQGPLESELLIHDPSAEEFLTVGPTTLPTTEVRQLCDEASEALSGPIARALRSQPPGKRFLQGVPEDIVEDAHERFNRVTVAHEALIDYETAAIADVLGRMDVEIALKEEEFYSAPPLEETVWEREQRYRRENQQRYGEAQVHNISVRGYTVKFAIRQSEFREHARLQAERDLAFSEYQLLVRGQ